MIFKVLFTRNVTVPITVNVYHCVCVTGCMGFSPNLSVKVPITIGTMVNFDGHRDGHGDVTCKQTFSLILSKKMNYCVLVLKFVASAWNRKLKNHNLQWSMANI